jgi:predicted CoA-binding protein
VCAIGGAFYYAAKVLVTVAKILVARGWLALGPQAIFATMEDWRGNLIDGDGERLLRLLRESRRVAVLGIKTDAASGQPAYYVPQALQQMGLEIVPVPVYYPDAIEILGQKVYRRVADVPGEIDIVDVFRRSGDVAGHLADLLAKKPRAVWLQSGIRDDRTAEALARAGILVVQDRCLMVDYRAVARSR